MDYAQMDIARRIKEALYEDDRIHEAHSFSTKVKKDEFLCAVLWLIVILEHLKWIWRWNDDKGKNISRDF